MKRKLIFVFCAMSLTNLTFAMLVSHERGIKRKSSVGTLPENKKSKQIHLENENNESSFLNEQEYRIIEQAIEQLKSEMAPVVPNNISIAESIALRSLAQQMQQMTITLPFTGQKIHFQRSTE